MTDGAGAGRSCRASDSENQLIRAVRASHKVSVTKADYELTPVSNRYGAKIIDDGGRKAGYVNLRTFINTADPALRNAFASFKAAGVTDIIVDLLPDPSEYEHVGEVLATRS